ncbi:NAD-dependent epimerase/dehydratase family protein [Sandaracinobacteroides hominis]|uniref:NAD-dependent epimerase/dehydratase family protein n=1 Tax=Sandaracinobacteroides hominis TaxID=2780086 RepID=UPI0018F432DF|nr:NAD(P)-dependent oxidoreductase [Sandaracinobacteroides hominis]
MALTLAITGGTGFVGGHAIDKALAQGHQVRALTRRPQPDRKGVTWVKGDLANPQALQSLVSGADAVIHIAGVTNTRHKPEFDRGNVLGTAYLRRAAGPTPFLHISSLSAREPQLSTYGLSKLRGEQVARGVQGPFAILRPPAVYGPGDEEYLALLRTAKSGLLPLPANAVTAMIYGPDLAAAIVALAEDLAGPATSNGGTFEIDDGAGGYTQSQVAEAISNALGAKVRPIELPSPVIGLAAGVDSMLCRLAGRTARLSRDRARYFAHPDWSANSDALLSLKLWKPSTDLQHGMAKTAAWYREKGLLG